MDDMKLPDKYDATPRASMIWAICINSAVLIFFLLFTNLRYGSNDDYAIGGAILIDGYYYLPFTNFFLGNLVGSIQKITLFWNAWVGCQIMFSFIAFVAMTYILLEKAKNSIWLRALAVCIVLVFACNHYSVVQFTQTAALLMVAGSIIIIYTIEYTSEKIPLIIGGCIFLLGSWYRFKGINVAFGFALVFIVFLVFHHRKQIQSCIKNNKFNRVQFIIVAVVILVVVGTNQLSIYIHTSTPELKYFKEYNLARAQFMDYPKLDYAENEAFFKELGISENDYILMSNWIHDSNTVASLENLRKINQHREREQAAQIDFSIFIYDFMKNTRYDVRDLTMRGINTVFLIMLAILILVAIRFRNWPVFICFAAAYFIFYLYLYVTGRYPYRASYIIDLAAAVWCVYAIKVSNLRSIFQRKSGSRSRLPATLVAIAVVVFTVIILNGSNALKFTEPRLIPPLEGPSTISQYMMDNPEKTFVLSARASRYNRTGSIYDSYTKLKTIGSNTFSFGGWAGLAPFENARLAERGLTNVFGDIIDDESVYVFELRDDRVRMLEQFFTDHYAPAGKIIYFEHVKELGDVSLWQVKTGTAEGR